MFKRKIKPELERALNRSPVVLLNGARQVGKTTLAQEIVKERNYTYLTFDDEMVYLAAKENPSGFIVGLPKPIVLDEVQRIPEIFLAIKQDVDKNRIPGRYLLTGSANPLLIPRLGDSLAGRMEVLDLMPLSQGEIYNTQESFIDTIFSNTQLQTPKKDLSKEKLFERIIMGGYPWVQNHTQINHDAWMRSYLNLILQRDIKDLANIEKLAEIPNLLKILASRTGGLLNIADLSRESKLVNKTLNRYLVLLETIFLIYTQRSWHNNITLRYTKAPKVYFTDSGLLAYLLNSNLTRSLSDGTLAGKLVENFVVNELRKQTTWSITRPELYYFRTSNGQEVDIILENRSGEIIGIEIKATTTATINDTKGLTYLQETMGKIFIRGIVLYCGDKYVPFSKNISALPINALWE